MLELLQPPQAAQWLRSRVTASLRTDSRKVRPGDGFIAWPGAATDGRHHVAAALQNGACACLVEHAGVDAFGFENEAIATYPQLKAATGPIAAAYFEQPTQQLDVIAITGTNGKTSTAWWLAHALLKIEQILSVPCGLVGTLGIGWPRRDDAGRPHSFKVVANGLTTPDPVLLQQSFRDMADAGVQACAIEASSIGLEEHRLDGTRIRTAVFTNFTHDHLDYHGSMQAYWQAKASLFAWPGLQSAVVNVDDAKGIELVASLRADIPACADAGFICDALDLWTVSCTGPARLQARDVQYGAAGLHFCVVEGDEQHPLATQLIGQYNVSNLLCVIGAMRSLGVPLSACVAACHRLSPVPGRMEFQGAQGQPLVAVDYAHTPDALGHALQALRPLVAQRGGQLWCVFGCGGDRDPIKRPLMGAMAARHADRVIVTSDNPRSEQPQGIINQILSGLAGFEPVALQADRALAIAQALAQADARDVVLVAGKGHEDYQDIAGVKHPFSDRVQVAHALQGWVPSASAIAPKRASNSTVSAQPGGGQVSGMLRLQQALQWLADARLVGDGSVMLHRVHTDTRSIEPGDLFVALKGERFDANDFLAEAKAKGAVAALCHSQAQLDEAGLPGLVVADTLLALGQLASAWRAQFKLPLIAVTGSNGKTTVTQMIAAILRAHAPDATLATQGNFNNDIGVPLTLLRLRANHKIAVVELGMNHPGEIALLAGMARPTVALVNNAQREHLEFMATLEAVAAENGAVIASLAGNGVAVYPQDDAFAPVWHVLAGQRPQLTFAIAPEGVADGDAGADVVCTVALWTVDAWEVSASTPVGPLVFALHVAGLHNVKNSLAAIACALAAGVPIEAIVRGLEAFEPVKGRSRALSGVLGGRAYTLVDDTYNANPDSVRAAIDVLAGLPGPRLLVLGDMGEVGTQGPQFHAEAGDYAKACGIENLFTLGDLSATASSQFGAGRHFNDIDALNKAVVGRMARCSSVLVKGSRFMKMEHVVEAFTAYAQLHQKLPCS